MSDINKQLVDILKDVRDYFANQDSEQEKAKIDKTPKVQEGQKPIKGGTTPAGFKPSSGIAKQVIKVPVEGSTLAEIRGSAVEPDEDSLLKEEPIDEEPVVEDEGEVVEDGDVPVEDDLGEEIPEDEEEKSVSNDLEIKSLLKDISTSLNRNAMLQKELADIKKSVKEEIAKGIKIGMRKQGFVLSRAPVSRLGIAKEDEIKKSEVKAGENVDNVLNVVDQLSKKSWTEIANLRVESGDLKPFAPYFPIKK